MKSSYEGRAYKTARMLANLFEYCRTRQDFEETIDWYNTTHAHKFAYASGVSRIVFMRADYVIKFEIVPDDKWRRDDGSCIAGSNFSEYQMYRKAVQDGFDYLFAKTTLVYLNGRCISIMPRINGVDDCTRCCEHYLTEEECDWVYDHVYDLHEGNLGYRKGKPCFIDYAWVVGGEEEEEDGTEAED